MIDLVDIIKQHNNVLIVCHVRPDGDCLGAGFALTTLCTKLGKNVDFVCDSPYPAHYEFIKGCDIYNEIRQNEHDLAIAVDCADEFRLGKFSDKYFSSLKTINIDHHATNTNFAGINVVVPDVSSTCEVLYSLLSDSNLIDADIAECLYIGLSTDTGHFRHSNVTPTTLYSAAKLLEYGIDAAKLVDKLYKSNTMGKLKLVGVALNKMRYFADNRICVIALSQKDIADCACEMSDTEGIIDYPMTVNDVLVAVCMSQQSKSSFKVSFRSKGPDVAAIAAKFGGGGHVLASGCVVNGDFNACVNKVVAAILEDI